MHSLAQNDCSACKAQDVDNGLSWVRVGSHDADRLLVQMMFLVNHFVQRFVVQGKVGKEVTDVFADNAEEDLETHGHAVREFGETHVELDLPVVEVELHEHHAGVYYELGNCDCDHCIFK